MDKFLQPSNYKETLFEKIKKHAVIETIDVYYNEYPLFVDKDYLNTLLDGEKAHFETSLKKKSYWKENNLIEELKKDLIKDIENCEYEKNKLINDKSRYMHNNNAKDFIEPFCIISFYYFFP